MSLTFISNDGYGHFTLNLAAGGYMYFPVTNYIKTDVKEVLKALEKLINGESGHFRVYNCNGVSECWVNVDNNTFCVSGGTMGGSFAINGTSFTVPYNENRGVIHKFYEFIYASPDLE